MWKSNMESVNTLDEMLTANVTYYKKEGSTKVGAMSEAILNPEQ